MNIRDFLHHIREKPGLPIAAGGLAVVLAIALFLRWLYGPPVTDRESDAVDVPGWGELSQCSDTVSLDGVQSLRLADDHTATIRKKAADRKAPGEMIHGSWEFPGRPHSFVITMDGKRIVYTLVTPGNGDACMLIHGPLQDVDLTTSWFSAPDDNQPDTTDAPD
jgi:hypothetical protein